MTRLFVLVGCLVASLSTPVLAEGNWPFNQPFNASPIPTPLSEAQKRRIMLPAIRSATDCIAQHVLANPAAIDAYRTLNLSPVIEAAWQPCLPDLTRVATQHDGLHGPGTGVPFVRGPYRDDLPRAVTIRIKPEIERRIAVIDTEAARQRFAAEQAEQQRRVEAAREQARKQAETERRTRTADSSRDTAYECTTAEIIKTVVSRESAETLATAAMVSCREEVSNAIETRIDVLRIEPAYLSDQQVRSYREELRSAMRTRIVTDAVKVKAAVNTPASLTPSIASVPPAPVGTPQTVPASLPPKQPDVPATMAAALGPKLTECLKSVNAVQQGKLVNREGLLKAMTDFCRPEIETVARDHFLADKSNTTIDEHRRQVAEVTMNAAVVLADGAGK